VPSHGLIKVGAEVKLAPGWEGMEHARDGPLKPGGLGEVVGDDLSGDRPWRVKVGRATSLHSRSCMYPAYLAPSVLLVTRVLGGTWETHTWVPRPTDGPAGQREASLVFVRRPHAGVSGYGPAEHVSCPALPGRCPAARPPLVLRIQPSLHPSLAHRSPLRLFCVVHPFRRIARTNDACRRPPSRPLAHPLLPPQRARHAGHRRQRRGRHAGGAQPR
jgi:hypothetical protein